MPTLDVGATFPLLISTPCQRLPQLVRVDWNQKVRFRDTPGHDEDGNDMTVRGIFLGPDFSTAVTYESAGRG